MSSNERQRLRYLTNVEHRRYDLCTVTFYPALIGMIVLLFVADNPVGYVLLLLMAVLTGLTFGTGVALEVVNLRRREESRS